MYCVPLRNFLAKVVHSPEKFCTHSQNISFFLTKLLWSPEKLCETFVFFCKSIVFSRESLHSFTKQLCVLPKENYTAFPWETLCLLVKALKYSFSSHLIFPSQKISERTQGNAKALKYNLVLPYDTMVLPQYVL